MKKIVYMLLLSLFLYDTHKLHGNESIAIPLTLTTKGSKPLWIYEFGLSNKTVGANLLTKNGEVPDKDFYHRQYKKSERKNSQKFILHLNKDTKEVIFITLQEGWRLSTKNGLPFAKVFNDNGIKQLALSISKSKSDPCPRRILSIENKKAKNNINIALLSPYALPSNQSEKIERKCKITIAQNQPIGVTKTDAKKPVFEQGSLTLLAGQEVPSLFCRMKGKDQQTKLQLVSPDTSRSPGKQGVFSWDSITPKKSKKESKILYDADPEIWCWITTTKKINEKEIVDKEPFIKIGKNYAQIGTKKEEGNFIYNNGLLKITLDRYEIANDKLAGIYTIKQEYILGTK